MSSMSITQALAELKLLRKRLDSGLYGVEWVKVSTKTQPVNTEKFMTAAKGSLQSYTDLYDRYVALKTAIVRANADTRVKVGSWEGSIADAIECKRSIDLKKRLLDTMREQLVDVRAQYDQEQARLTERLERLLVSELGKDVRTNPETITALSTTFRANNPIEFIDPLDLANRVKVLEQEIDSFETNIDWVLSEANGRTMINL
jgi:predicted nuclease with TOPRIM domain